MKFSRKTRLFQSRVGGWLFVYTGQKMPFEQNIPFFDMVIVDNFVEKPDLKDVSWTPGNLKKYWLGTVRNILLS